MAAKYRLVVKYRMGKDGREDFVNAPCDKLEIDGNFAKAWDEDGLVGMWDLGVVDMIYRTPIGGAR